MTTNTITSHVVNVTLQSGGSYGNPLTIASTGSVTGSTYAITGSAIWTILNRGIVNGAAGAGSGIQLNAGGSVGNSGAISGFNAGIRFTDGGSVTNDTSGSISGGRYGVYIIGATGTIDNFGMITATGNDGVQLGNGGSVTNETGGSIISAGKAAVYLNGGGSVTNEAGGVITGGTYGILGSFSQLVTVDNLGTVTGTQGAGIRLDSGGAVTNASTGTITGLYQGIDGPVSLVDNYGTIQATNSKGSGIFANGSGITLDNTGLIRGGSGVKFFSDSVLLKNSGTIQGTAVTGNYYGVFLQGLSSTLENSGTIIGTGYAVKLMDTISNRLVVDAGAVFTGKVAADTTATNTIELTTGATIGTLSGLGSEYAGFQTVTIDSGGAWDIAGTMAGFNGTAIKGFNTHDRLDLTNLTFNAADTATVNSSGLLTMKKGTTMLASIQLDGSVSGQLFKLVSDGHSGTFVEENAYTPCYCRGTRIRTAAGDRAVEDLRIGDLIVTAAGEVLPLKWIGLRSYRDWLAVGNRDVQPILFKAGSLADGVPARHLYVSPEHAMFLEGMLIPAHHLVNGISIVKVAGMEAVDYFHLEFDRHVVILAEGAEAESFVDDDDRMLFHNADEYRRLYPSQSRSRFVEFCAPRVEGGYELETIRRRLIARAARLLPDGTAAPAPVHQGCLDRATLTVIEGWAFGPEDRPVRLAVIVNGAMIGQTVANRYVADLAEATDGHWRCGFRFALPHGLSSDISHRIEVRRESDWSLLQNGRVTLEPNSVDVSLMSQAGAMDFTQFRGRVMWSLSSTKASPLLS